MARKKYPNILLIAVDSLRRDRMSLHGYHRRTTPHIDRFAEGGTVFENTISAHIPTTSAYASMLTGRDCFGTQVVALRHKGGLRSDVRTLAEMLREEAGYETTCVGFSGNPAGRGFDQYLNYPSWGSWEAGRSPKAQHLNEVAIPEIDRLAAGDKPWFVMLRHMDPHSPYLPPAPYEKMFYHGDPTDPAKETEATRRMWDFKPFRDYFATWMPPGLTDLDYVDAQYDGAVAYMDACIQSIFQQLETLGILDETIVILNGDHGETLQEHEHWYDHHGLYEPNLVVPLVIRYPKKVPAGLRVAGYNQHKDLVPTVLDLAGVKVKEKLDGKTLMTLIREQQVSFEPEIYLTECTWMRKHGWRTPQWKLIVALEPDFHFHPEVELYDLVADPLELENVAQDHPEVVETLRQRMKAHIAAREKQTGLTNPMHTQGDWANAGAPFTSSEAAYEKLHIGDAKAAAKLQAKAAAGGAKSSQAAAKKTAKKTTKQKSTKKKTTAKRGRR